MRLADEGGRAILLLNRRGEAPALHCRSCGEGFRCERCDVSLALHAGHRLRCHHCGYTQRAPSECPHCGSVELARLGAGTERVSEAVNGAAAAHPGAAARRRRDASAAAASTRRSSASRASPPPCSSARRWSRRATTSATCAWRRRSTPTRAWPGPTSAARSARSRCSRSSRGAAAAAAIPARWSSRPGIPTSGWCASRPSTPSRRSWRASWSAASGSATRRSATSCASRRRPSSRARRWRRSRRCAPRPSRRCPGDEVLGPGAALPGARARARPAARQDAAAVARRQRAGRARRAPGPCAAARGGERRGRRRPSVRCLRWPLPNTITITTTAHDHGRTTMITSTITAAAAQQEGDRARGPCAGPRDGRAQPDPAVPGARPARAGDSRQRVLRRSARARRRA